MIWPWSKKDNSHTARTEELERAVSIQVRNHTNAADEVVAEAQEIADNFNRIVNNNGFSLVITVGAARKKKQ